MVKESKSSISAVKPSRRSFISPIPSRLTVALLAAALLVGFGNFWYVLQAVDESKERDLEARLAAVAQVAAYELQSTRSAPMVRLANLTLALYDPDRGEEFLSEITFFQETHGPQLVEFLQTLVSEGNLEQAMIVDIREQAIADSKQEEPSFEQFDLLSINRAEMQRALESGKTVPTLYYEVQGKPYKYSYTPLTDEQTGEVFGFLRLMASAGHFEQMRQLRNQLVALSGVTAVLLGIVALIFHRLLRYVLGAEKAAAQADRLQSVATLAAGFAHEVRNPLGILRSSAEGLAEELAEKEDAGAIELSRDMVGEVDRLNQLITQFLDFAGPSGESAWSPVNVSEVLLGVLSLARKDLEAKQIEVRRDFDESAPPVQANAKSLTQVFLNVLLNAKDATEPGGSITLSTRARRGRLVIAFEDTGHGISEADLKSVFDPFFTTKTSGTGLGLSISRNIIRQFNGDMEIKSQKGRGTTVEISFPV